MPSDVITASGHQDVDIRGGAFQANARLERACGSDGRGQVRAGGGHSRSGHRAGSGDEAEPRRSATGFRRDETRVCWARGSQARAGRSQPAASQWMQRAADRSVQTPAWLGRRPSVFTLSLLPPAGPGHAGSRRRGSPTVSPPEVGSATAFPRPSSGGQFQGGRACGRRGHSRSSPEAMGAAGTSSHHFRIDLSL